MISSSFQHRGKSVESEKITNASITSPKKRDAGVVITQVGLLTNLTMAVVKGVSGYVFKSKTMMADAIHGATDAISDTLALVAITWGSRPPTSHFPYGHGKIESLGALGVSAILLMGSLSMGFDSLQFLLLPFRQGKQSVIIHGPTHEEATVGTFVYLDGDLLSHIFVIGISLVTITAKEWLYSASKCRCTPNPITQETDAKPSATKLAMERRSTVLASSALHNRVDSFTEVIIICVILTSKLIREVAWLDTVGGLFISLLAVRPAAEFTMSALRELVDYSIDEGVKGEIRFHSEDILGEIDESGQVEVISIMGTKSGQRNLINLEMVMPSSWTIDEAFELEVKFRSELEKRTQMTCHYQIHIRPAEGND
ncbi:Cation efflux family [Fusarium globosum]|uniref:Cation efflux family n=1 Tax=Fusarium globosum TaxID=78864 RepID=A0A8H5YCH1_9HYPO|nr:Cation efflux family [Fusarium globosum]